MSVNQRPAVAVALSGGVDSAAAAVLLQRGGFEVTALTARLTGGTRNPAVECAQGVAEALGMKHEVIDLTGEFERLVVRPFIEAYADGLTPNPCVNCNREVKFGLLLQEARKRDCEYLATGHYARITGGGDRPFTVRLPADRGRDQTYVLWTLGQRILRRVLFPVGGLTRDEAARVTRDAGVKCLSPSSQDICFLAGERYADLVKRRAPHRVTAGPVLDEEGNVLGEHLGLAYYTVGQRRGLGLGGYRALYVLEIRQQDNSLVVGKRERLSCGEFPVEGVRLLSGEKPGGTIPCRVKTRYRGPALAAELEFLAGGRCIVRYREPGPAAAPGQSAVFYREDEMLGGGIIGRRAPGLRT